MINAKTELTRFLEHKPLVKCALISFDKGNEPNTDIGEFILKVGYTELDWEDFLAFLNFEYNDWSGQQQLFGIVWVGEDGWCDRNSYHGKEWWQHHTTPTIPAICL
jgi:hypothetical protein